MWRFDYLEPKSARELLALLDKSGKKSAILAGGTDIIPKLTKRTARPQYVINIKGIKRLDSISYSEKSGLRIGALVTLREIEKNDLISSYYPVLAEAAHTVGSMQVRNLATMVGNICNAAPSADTVPALLTLGAKLKIVGSSGSRVVPLNEFFLAPWKTVLLPSEYAEEIVIPRVASGSGVCYMKHSIRKAMDMALVGVAVRLEVGSDNICKDASIALGATAPTPMRAYKAERVLKGERISEELLVKAGAVAATEAKPRSYPEYKREMVQEFTLRAGRVALERALGK